MINENSLYHPADHLKKEYLLNKKDFIANAFWINTIGLLALVAVDSGKAPLKALLKDAGSFLFKDASDESGDALVALKLMVDAGAILPATATKLGKILQAVKLHKYDSDTLPLDEIQELLGEIKLNVARPDMFLRSHVEALVNGEISLKQFGGKLGDVLRMRKKEFAPVAGEFLPLLKTYRAALAKAADGDDVPAPKAKAKPQKSTMSLDPVEPKKDVQDFSSWTLEPAEAPAAPVAQTFIKSASPTDNYEKLWSSHLFDADFSARAKELGVELDTTAGARKFFKWLESTDPQMLRLNLNAIFDINTFKASSAARVLMSADPVRFPMMMLWRTLNSDNLNEILSLVDSGLTGDVTASRTKIHGLDGKALLAKLLDTIRRLEVGSVWTRRLQPTAFEGIGVRLGKIYKFGQLFGAGKQFEQSAFVGGLDASKEETICYSLAIHADSQTSYDGSRKAARENLQSIVNLDGVTWEEFKLRYTIRKPSLMFADAEEALTNWRSNPNIDKNFSTMFVLGASDVSGFVREVSVMWPNVQTTIAQYSTAFSDENIDGLGTKAGAEIVKNLKPSDYDAVFDFVFIPQPQVGFGAGTREYDVFYQIHLVLCNFLLDNRDDVFKRVSYHVLRYKLAEFAVSDEGLVGRPTDNINAMLEIVTNIPDQLKAESIYEYYSMTRNRDARQVWNTTMRWGVSSQFILDAVVLRATTEREYDILLSNSARGYMSAAVKEKLQNQVVVSSISLDYFVKVFSFHKQDFSEFLDIDKAESALNTVVNNGGFEDHHKALFAALPKENQADFYDKYATRVVDEKFGFNELQFTRLGLILNDEYIHKLFADPEFVAPLKKVDDPTIVSLMPKDVLRDFVNSLDGTSNGNLKLQLLAVEGVVARNPEKVEPASAATLIDIVLKDERVDPVDFKPLIESMFTKLNVEDQNSAAKLYDRASLSVKRVMLDQVSREKALNKALGEIAGDDVPVKPFGEITTKRIAEILAFNDIVIDDLPNPVDGEAYTTTLRKYTPNLNIQKLEIQEQVMPTDALEKLSVEYDKYNRYKHGNVTILFKRVFNVKVPIQEQMFKAFVEEKKAKGVDPMLMHRVFHGTSSVGAAMILRNGFRVVAASDSSVAGRSLGDGIYFTNVLDKASQYVGDTGDLIRTRGVRGYVMEMDAALGEHPEDFDATATGNWYDNKQFNFISPEWCVRNGNAQLRIYKCYEVELGDVDDMQELRKKWGGKLHEAEGVKSFKDFTGPSVQQSYISYVFTDGTVLTKDGSVEAYKLKKLPKGVFMDFSAKGPVVMVPSDENRRVVVRKTRWFMNWTDEDFRLYAKAFGIKDVLK